MDKKKLLLGAVMVTLSGVAAEGVAAATDALNVEALIVAPGAIVLSSAQALNFGTFLASGAPGTVAITPAGGSTYLGGVTQVNAGSETQAILGVWADQQIKVEITSPVATIASGGNTMQVSLFDIDGGGNSAIYPMSTTNNLAVPIGATLTVPANQPAGTYTGTFTVNVDHF